jgi:lambda repressor-like predicted transcriptional regulator
MDAEPVSSRHEVEEGWKSIIVGAPNRIMQVMARFAERRGISLREVARRSGIKRENLKPSFLAAAPRERTLRSIAAAVDFPKNILDLWISTASGGFLDSADALDLSRDLTSKTLRNPQVAAEMIESIKALEDTSIRLVDMAFDLVLSAALSSAFDPQNVSVAKDLTTSLATLECAIKTVTHLHDRITDAIMKTTAEVTAVGVAIQVQRTQPSDYLAKI